MGLADARASDNFLPSSRFDSWLAVSDTKGRLTEVAGVLACPAGWLGELLEAPAMLGFQGVFFGRLPGSQLQKWICADEPVGPPLVLLEAHS